MDIVINGRPLQDARVKNTASLKALMTDLARVLGEREEVVMEVSVNGKEISEWDVVDVPLADADHLDIQTLSTQDYAIASLGDLGEYSGNVLSVLRNIENITRKDGFLEVRDRLVDGLDYILSVIETAGQILQLNLKDTRYDMRSGEQMIKELQSLKSRISAAGSLDDIRPVMSSLEFTLTDWLKFLETLLKRYADRQAEAGTPEEISDEAGQRAGALESLHADLKTLIDDLYAGRVAKTMEALPARITVLQDSLSYIQQLRKLGLIQYQTLQVNDERMIDKIPKLADICRELSEAIQVGDTVLMRDLIEYEILPFISYLREAFRQISSAQNKPQ